MMGSIKWNAEMNSKFISLYKQQEALWRTDCLIYRDKEARTEGLQKIIAGMGLPDLTLDSVKKKIKYLRSTYMSEVHKIEKSAQSGTKSIYKPCLSWFNEMDSFIKYVAVKRNTQSTSIPQLNSYDSEDEQPEANHKTCITKIEINGEQEEALSTGEERYPTQERTEHSVRPLRRMNKPKRRRLHQLNSVVKEIKNISEDLMRESKKPSEYEVFGNYVGIQLQSLLEEDAIVAQEEIQSILTRYKLKKIRLKNRTSSSADSVFNNSDNSSSEHQLLQSSSVHTSVESKNPPHCSCLHQFTVDDNVI